MGFWMKYIEFMNKPILFPEFWIAAFMVLALFLLGIGLKPVADEHNARAELSQVDE